MKEMNERGTNIVKGSLLLGLHQLPFKKVHGRQHTSFYFMEGMAVVIGGTELPTSAPLPSAFALLPKCAS